MFFNFLFLKLVYFLYFASSELCKSVCGEETESRISKPSLNNNNPYWFNLMILMVMVMMVMISIAPAPNTSIIMMMVMMDPDSPQ